MSPGCCESRRCKRCVFLRVKTILENGQSSEEKKRRRRSSLTLVLNLIPDTLLRIQHRMVRDFFQLIRINPA